MVIIGFKYDIWLCCVKVWRHFVYDRYKAEIVDSYLPKIWTITGEKICSFYQPACSTLYHYPLDYSEMILQWVISSENTNQQLFFGCLKLKYIWSRICNVSCEKKKLLLTTRRVATGPNDKNPCLKDGSIYDFLEVSARIYSRLEWIFTRLTYLQVYVGLLV